MTQKERAIIQQIVNHFDYHNKNLTKAQDWQMYRLKELLGGHIIED